MEDKCDTCDKCPRRKWLIHTLVGVNLATIGSLLYPVVRFLSPRRSTRHGTLNVIAPYRVDQLRPNAEGEWPAPFEFAGKPCVLVRTPDGEIKAFNAICTHTDCTVKYRPDEGDIFCSCHGGAYDLNGRNIAGPPPRPLEPYKVILRGKPGQEEIVVTRA